jgi:hypothetical protein
MWGNSTVSISNSVEWPDVAATIDPLAKGPHNQRCDASVPGLEPVSHPRVCSFLDTKLRDSIKLIRSWLNHVLDGSSQGPVHRIWNIVRDQTVTVGLQPSSVVFRHVVEESRRSFRCSIGTYTLATTAATSTKAKQSGVTNAALPGAGSPVRAGQSAHEHWNGRYMTPDPARAGWSV